MNQVFSILVSLLFSLTVLAHGGHDHDTPSMVQAPKGGIIKGNEKFHIEVVPKGNELKIYIYTLDLKPVDVSKVKLSLTTEMPRTKKTSSIPVAAKGDHFAATFDAKGVHRYTLIVLLGDHDDRLTFTIEPKK